MSEWDGQDRRRAESLQQHHALNIDQIELLLAHGRKDQREHFDKLIDEMLSLFKSGFPEGDPVEHRKVHESYIREAKERAELWRGMRMKLLSGGVLAVFGVLGSLGVWVAHVAWEAFKRDFLR